MRRPPLRLLFAVVLSGTVIGGGRVAVAQVPGPGDHPANGSWTVETDPGDAEYSPRLMILSADGGAIFVSGYGNTGVGAWAPTSETTAAVTFTAVTNGPAQIVIRISLEVASDGQALTGTFTNEVQFDPAGGGTSGEIGPGTIGGARLAAEAPGTPTQTFAEFFALPAGTPAATPAT
ncbi:MAG: hypothetical protein H0U10_13940 [Chloroflexia bacterium]|nr:hypothetical protein [Chloroflexia bacterium]